MGAKIRSIKIKYLISGLLICIISLLSVCSISYYFSYNITSDQSNNRLHEAAMRKAAELDSWFMKYTTIVSDLVEDCEITGNTSDDYLQKLLVGKHGKYIDDVLDFYIGFNDKSRVLISGTNWIPDSDYDCTQRTWYIQAVKAPDEIVFTSPYVDAMTKSMVITISKAVKDNHGAIIGVLAADIYIDNIIDLVKNYTIGNGGYTFLLDDSGNILTHQNKQFLPTENGLTNITDLKNTQYSKFTNILDSNELNAMLIRDYDNTDKYFMLSKIKSSNWIFGIAIDQSEYKEPLRMLLFGFLIAFLISIVLGVIIILKFMSAMVKPIKTLNSAVKSFSEKNMDVRTNIDLKDEIGELGRSFNMMADTIQEYSVTLENKVIERTQQLHEINQAILESIHYAERIQRAILPDVNTQLGMDKDNCFTIWIPRDVVGGDFYWCKSEGQYSLLIVADCTGHGIPGALMTMTLSTILDSFSKNIGELTPARILDITSKSLKEVLGQNKEDSIANDGADMAVCLIDKRNDKLIFAGAKLSLFTGYNGIITQYKGNTASVGYSNDKHEDFNDLDIHLEDGMTVYISTDGLLDQNFEQGKGGMAKTGFTRFLEKIQSLSFNEQHDTIQSYIDGCLKNVEQRDDITVVAFKYNKGGK